MMNKLVNLRNFLILIVLVLLGYIFLLKGCNGDSENTTATPTKIKIYFNKIPEKSYLDSLKAYFETSLGIKLTNQIKSDSLYKILNNQPVNIIQVQDNILRPSTTCTNKYGKLTQCSVFELTIIKPGPKDKELILRLINLQNIPLNLKANISQMDLLTQIVPN